MGELIAFLSATLFGAANVLVNKGATPASQDNGVFISILLTIVIAAVMFVATGMARGWPTLSMEGLFWFGFAGIMTSFLGRVFLYSSIQYLGSVRASTVKRLNPFFAVIIGVTVLGERFTPVLAIGMTLIFSGFTILATQAYRDSSVSDNGAVNVSLANSANAPPISWERFRGTLKSLANLGYLFGPISALSYAVGYVGRKRGLLEIPDPYLGTMAGAIVGASMFLIMALFQARYRAAVRLTFSEFNIWLFWAGVAASVGQVLYFVALSYIEVSRVALITSLEVFVTIFLSIWIFRMREKLTPAVVLAAAVSVAGAAILVW